MRRQTMRGFLAASLLVVLVSGCATQEQKRVAMLEQVNRDLTQRLNGARSEVGNAARDRDELNRRLQLALDESSELQARLAAMPTLEPAAPGWTAVPGGAMIAIEGAVLFAPGRAKIRPQAQKALGAIVSTLQGQYADKDILVVGHTDDQPIKKSGWTDNYQLSTERSLAVVRHLQSQGVSPTRLIAGGGGQHRPRVTGTSKAGRAANRRVEIFAIEPLSTARRP